MTRISDTARAYSRYFNPHPRMEDDIYNIKEVRQWKKFQSTSSHGGWRFWGQHLFSRGKFQSTSSHGGWPGIIQSKQYRDYISIHILAWRMTVDGLYMAIDSWISIHILAWRMTVAIDIALTATVDFNPHPRMEDDDGLRPVHSWVSEFQSTSSHGGWRMNLIQSW